MAINAHAINGSDPGAVPGGSTKLDALSLEWQSGAEIRIDGRVKVLAFARWGTAVIGPNAQLPMTIVLRWQSLLKQRTSRNSRLAL